MDEVDSYARATLGVGSLTKKKQQRHAVSIQTGKKKVKNAKALSRQASAPASRTQIVAKGAVTVKKTENRTSGKRGPHDEKGKVVKSDGKTDTAKSAVKRDDTAKSDGKTDTAKDNAVKRDKEAALKEKDKRVVKPKVLKGKNKTAVKLKDKKAVKGKDKKAVKLKDKAVKGKDKAVKLKDKKAVKGKDKKAAEEKIGRPLSTANKKRRRRLSVLAHLSTSSVRSKDTWRRRYIDERTTGGFGTLTFCGVHTCFDSDEDNDVSLNRVLAVGDRVQILADEWIPGRILRASKKDGVKIVLLGGREKGSQREVEYFSPLLRI